MSKKLFSLRGVPEDEVRDVRRLLTEHHIDFYETPAGNWGISMPALWVKTEAEKVAAGLLIREYQRARSERVRAEYERARQAGEVETLRGRIGRNPMLALVVLLAVLTILYISIAPFIGIGG